MSAPSGSGGAGQSLYPRLSSSDEFAEMSDVPSLTGPGLPVQASWSRYVTGVDQAIERVRSEADARLLEEQQQPKPKQPGTSFLEEDDGAGRKTPAAFVKEAALEAGRIIKAKRTLIDAIDFAIGTLEPQEALRPWARCSRPTSGPRIERPSTPTARSRGAQPIASRPSGVSTTNRRKPTRSSRRGSPSPARST